jgi:hypothetical protein
MKFHGFIALLEVLFQEALYKGITIFSVKKIIPLSLWASQNGIKPNVAAKKAKRQTISAFHLLVKWKIVKDHESMDL